MSKENDAGAAGSLDGGGKGIDCLLGIHQCRTYFSVLESFARRKNRVRSEEEHDEKWLQDYLC